MRAHDRIVLVREAAQDLRAAMAPRVTLDDARGSGILAAKVGDGETATIGDAGHASKQHACALTGGSAMLMTETVGVRAFDSTSVANRPGTTDTPCARVSSAGRKHKQRRFGKVPAGRLAIDLYAAEAALYLPST
jgi:hypothetical protein